MTARRATGIGFAEIVASEPAVWEIQAARPGPQRSVPPRRGVGVRAPGAKGRPAMMMAGAALRDLACVLVPGGVPLPPQEGEDAGTVQAIGARFAPGELPLERAAELACRDCGCPGGG